MPLSAGSHASDTSPCSVVSGTLPMLFNSHVLYY